MRETRALSSGVDHSGSFVSVGVLGEVLVSEAETSFRLLLLVVGVVSWWCRWFGAAESWGESRWFGASKSWGERPRGRLGGRVRWRFGGEGWEGAAVCSSRLSSAMLKERRRLRLLRGCGFEIFAFGTGCDLGFFGCARGAADVRTMGLPRCGGARMILGLGERAGRLLARRDCSARHVLYMFELGDWQVDDGGESMVVAGM